LSLIVYYIIGSC